MVDREVAALKASLRAPVAVFRNPDLRRAELAWAAMSFAVWAYAIALGVYAFQIDGAAAVGLVALVRLLPGALAAPFAGLLGDTHSRRAVLVASAAATGVVLSASAAVAAADGAAAIVFVAAGLFALVTAAYQPVQSAFLPQLARTPQELAAANVALSVMDNVGFLLSGAGGGLLLALGGPELVFGFSGVAAFIAAAFLLGLQRDRRPDYVESPRLRDVARQTLSGARTVFGDPGLRLLGGTLTVLVFFEGMADVLVVIAALELLDLSEDSVGYLSAAWGVGALVAGAAAAVLAHRRRLARGIAGGAVVVGAAGALIAGWAVPVAAYAAYVLFGAGYTLVEVAGKTFLQRLASDEVLARVFGFLETSRLAAMAAGSIAAPLLVSLIGTRGALLAAGALVPAFVLARRRALRAFDTGAPVDARRYELLRNTEIFQPLPVATLERICNDLKSLEVEDGTEIITQGDRGDRFYLIEDGEVAIFDGPAHRCFEGEGSSFGEIALIRDVPRTASVRATCATRLLALDREQFITAVTGYHSSLRLTDRVIDRHLASNAGG